MEKQIFRVEPFATYAEKRKVPISLVVAHGGLVYVSQMPPYDPCTGEVGRFPVAEQMEIVIKQMEQCLQAAGSVLSKVVSAHSIATTGRTLKSSMSLWPVLQNKSTGSEPDLCFRMARPIRRGNFLHRCSLNKERLPAAPEQTTRRPHAGPLGQPPHRQVNSATRRELS
jgi:enamine deaminase RidA (YjgF/YER057c/UK114 family)